MRRLLSVLLVGLFTIPQSLAAQSVVPGSRVRVTHPGEGTRVGTVVSLTADTLAVRFAGRSDAALMSLDQVSRVDVSRGSERRVLRRAGVGFLVGAGGGAVFGAIAESQCDPATDFICLGADGGALLGGLFFGAVGGIVGAVAGLVPSERWEHVPVERRRIGIVTPATSSRKGLGLAIAF
jgi:hypothetical protein